MCKDGENGEKRSISEITVWPKKRDARKKLLFCQFIPIAFLPFSLPSSSSLLKLPNFWSSTPLYFPTCIGVRVSLVQHCKCGRANWSFGVGSFARSCLLGVCQKKSATIANYLRRLSVRIYSKLNLGRILARTFLFRWNLTRTPWFFKQIGHIKRTKSDTRSLLHKLSQQFITMILHWTFS